MADILGFFTLCCDYETPLLEPKWRTACSICRAVTTTGLYIISAVVILNRSDEDGPHKIHHLRRLPSKQKNFQSFLKTEDFEKRIKNNL